MKRIVVVLLFLFCLSGISALGVTPARNTIEFEPGFEGSYSFKILNTERMQRELVIYASGELADSIYLEKRRIRFEADEKEKIINYKLSLPQELAPGLRTAEIIIQEPVKEITDPDTVVGVTLSLITQVHVHVPYPGRYIDATLNIESAEENEPVIFSIPMINRGKADLLKVYANIDIYNEHYQLIENFNTESLSIKTGQRNQINHEYFHNLSLGNYNARVTLIYDGESKTLEKTFQIGEKTLELHQITVPDFRLGEIAKMELLVENKWAARVDNVYTQMQVFNVYGDKVSDFRSLDNSIEPLSKKVLVSYWDTIGLREGTYDSKVLIHFPDGKPIETNLKLILKSDSIEIIGLGYVISERGSAFDFSENILMIIVIVVIVLVLVNVLWFLILRRLMLRVSRLKKN